MNYLGHARRLLDRPWATVGASLPDWMKIVDRRARRLDLDGRIPHDEPQRDLYEGIRVYTADNRRFHENPVFRRMCGDVATLLRERHPDRPERRFRASFFAHLLIELLLDAEIDRRDPAALPRYYAILDGTDPAELAERARPLAPAAAGHLPELLVRFRESRFLGGYADDEALLRRLDGAGRRLGQPPLPEELGAEVAATRLLVRDAFDQLLTAPPPGRHSDP